VASAAAAARAEVIATYDVATVLDDSDVPGGAASFKSRDWCQSIRSLPADLVNPCGSLMDGMRARVNERQIMSFI